MAKTFEIVGMKDVNKFLKGMDVKTNKKIMNAGLAKTGAIVKNTMKQNLKSGRGGSYLTSRIKMWQGKKTRRALKWIGFKRMATKTDKQQAAYNKALGNRSGSTDRARRAWMEMGAYWLEFGTLDQMTIPRRAGTRSLINAQGRTGKRGARIAPIAWFRKAVDQEIDPMMLNFSKNMGKVIDRHIMKSFKRVT